MEKLKHFQFKHPFTAMISGPTSSGKTVLTRDILKYFLYTIHIANERPSTLNVLWCYGVWQPAYSVPVSDRVNIHYYQGFPSSSEELLKIKPHIVVIDDLMSQLSEDPALAELFTKGSHHYGISIIFITQNLLPKG